MNYRDKTLIRGESLYLKVVLYCENSATGKLEKYDATELTDILNSTKNNELPLMVAEARLSDGKRIPLTIIQELDDGVALDGALSLYSDVDTWNFPGESFDVNIVLKQQMDLGFRDDNDEIVLQDVKTATFNETFYIARSATDLREEPKEECMCNKGGHSVVYLLDGQFYACENHAEGDTITPMETPTREGYTFSGWSEIPETMPDHCVVVSGSLTKEEEEEIRPLNIVLDDARCCIKLPNGEYVATDFGHNCIRVFEPNSDGTPKITFNGFDKPVGICRDSDGYLWVVNYKAQGSISSIVKLSYDGNEIQQVGTVTGVKSPHPIIYNASLNKILSFSYGYDELYVIDPSDLTYTIIPTNAINLCNDVTLTADGTTFYALQWGHFLYRCVIDNNLLIKTEILTSDDLEDETTHSLKGICLTDDEHYLIISSDSSGCMYKLNLNNNNIEKIIENNDLAKCFQLTNNGDNVITFVGDTYKRICEINVTDDGGSNA